jgi:Xaa-Pro dipeptidase
MPLTAERGHGSVRTPLLLPLPRDGAIGGEGRGEGVSRVEEHVTIGRRDFFRYAGVGAAGIAAGSGVELEAQGRAAEEIPAGILALKSMTAGIVPISAQERQARIEKARRLMVEQKIDALLLEPGSSLFYFTGVQWGLSERPFAAVLPAKGEIAYICPKFEEMRAHELTKPNDEMRTWEEDESPYALIAGILRDRGIASGRIGVEERVRFFIVDGVRQEASGATFVNGTPISAGCRMIKSPAEIALLQRANDITLAAFKAALATLRAGMTQYELSRIIAAAHSALGGAGGSALVGFGQYSAFPHGSIKPQKLVEGDVVLIDGGCRIEGYESDITRTTVFGKPTPRLQSVWDTEKAAQAAALKAAQVGAPCEAVDAAARKVVTDAGFGPGYKLPGLPHRTGHGIGLDGHEWTNFVKGNKTPIAPGMCFSDEPMIAIYGEFGVRLEDCLYITEAGPKLFTGQSASIDKPCD